MGQFQTSAATAAGVAALKAAGHDVEVVGAMDEVMGHAGALVLHGRGAGARAGIIKGAADPRSDGRAAGF